MRIGVPKEIKVLENRVGLVPGSVREAVAHGHEVFVEQDAVNDFLSRHHADERLFDACNLRECEAAPQ